MARAIHEIDWARVIVLACKATDPRPRPKASIVNPVAAQLPEVFSRLDISSPRRQSHFISQAIVECDYFRTLEEYASGDAYDTRSDMGFTPARDGDGRTNKGFGIFQTTGPNNQRRALAELLKLGFRVSQDVAKAKAVLTDPRYAAWTAGIFWRDNKMNAIADRDATGQLCGRQINRGNWRSKKAANGEAERLKAFKATWRVLQNPPLLAAAPVAIMAGPHTPEAEEAAEHLGREEAAPIEELPPLEDAEEMGAPLAPAPSPGSPPAPLPAEPVAPGVPDGLTRAAQARLRDLGYFVVGNADGNPEGRTVAANAMFQHTAGLPVTGQLDQQTLAALFADDAPHAPVSPERALATAEDLRPTSAIVDATAKVQTASLWQVVVGGVTAAGTAVVSGFADTMSSLASVKAMFADVPGWVWALVAVLILSGPAIYSHIQARRAERARVADYNSGRTA